MRLNVCFSGQKVRGVGREGSPLTLSRSARQVHTALVTLG